MRYVLGLLSVTLLLLINAPIPAHPGPAGHGGPVIVAHRGASFDAPENTLAAFQLAFEQGADAIEGDFFLTSDNQVICSHDPTLKRTGGLDRKVTDMTLAEVRQVDVGSWKSPKFSAQRAPTLTEILTILPKNTQFLIEIKHGPEIVPHLKKVLAASNVPVEQLRLISFNAEVVLASKTQIPELKAFWLTSFKSENAGPKTPDLATILATLERTRADGLDCRADLEVLTPEFVAALRARAYEFHAWTVDDPAVAKALVALGVDSITTNRPAYLREQLRK